MTLISRRFTVSLAFPLALGMAALVASPLFAVNPPPALGTVPPKLVPATAPIFPGKEWQKASPESQGVDPQKLEAALQDVKSGCGSVGITQVVVVRNGYVIWQGEDVNNKHLIWSCTKSFTSTCLGLLWDDGKCSPATLACQIFPELKKDYPTMTLEHLATFTSGFNNEPGDLLKPGVPTYKPGAAFQYSRQTDLLAAILTRIAGESLESLFMRRIGNEIGLTKDQFEWKSDRQLNGVMLNGGAGFPESGVYCSAVGLARLGWLYTNGGNWNGKQLISRRYIEYACVPRVSAKVPPRDPKAFYVNLPGAYGLNWWVNGMTVKERLMWPNAPTSTFAAQGNENNICFAIPDWQMTIVRGGGDRILTTNYDGMFRLIKEGLPVSVKK